MTTELRPDERGQRPELVARHPNDGICVLEVRCELDMLTAPPLKQLLLDELSTGCRALVIDLTECEFIGSSGLAALGEGRERANSTSTRVVLAGVRHIASRVLQLTGMAPLFDIYATASDALSAVGGDAPSCSEDPGQQQL